MPTRLKSRKTLAVILGAISLVLFILSFFVELWFRFGFYDRLECGVSISEGNFRFGTSEDHTLPFGHFFFDFGSRKPRGFSFDDLRGFFTVLGELSAAGWVLLYLFPYISLLPSAQYWHTYY